VRITRRQLRQLIREEVRLAERDLGGTPTISQAKVMGPMGQFTNHLKAAKKSLGDVFQNAKGARAEQLAKNLLDALDRILNALPKMPELTQDPWHGARG